VWCVCKRARKCWWTRVPRVSRKCYRFGLTLLSTTQRKRKSPESEARRASQEARRTSQRISRAYVSDCFDVFARIQGATLGKRCVTRDAK
jgi:hypothetical protein